MQPLVLTPDEQTTLRTWASWPKSTQRLALRAWIVLTRAEGLANKAVAAKLRVVPLTLGKWRAQFLADRLEGLLDEPRVGAPRELGDEEIEAVITRTLKSMPAQATQWSTRGMAQAAGLSQSAVSRIWRTFGLKPHPQDNFRLSTDPQFIEKLRDVVGLYLAPPGAGHRVLRR